MSEDLFANPYSHTPDELWKAPSPRDRQLAAVEYWADLTGIQKTAGSYKKKMVDFLATKHGPDKATAAAIGALGGAESLFSSHRPNKASNNSLTSEQIDVAAEESFLRKKRELGEDPFIREKLLALKKRMADYRADNPMLAALLQAGVGGAAGYGASRYVRRKE